MLLEAVSHWPDLKEVFAEISASSLRSLSHLLLKNGQGVTD